MVHVGHKCVEWCKKNQSLNQVHPDPGNHHHLAAAQGQEVILVPPPILPQVVSESLHPPFPYALNTMQFNPEMVNPLISLLCSLVPPILLTLFFLDQLHFATFQIIFHVVFCFYIPFLFCIFCKKTNCRIKFKSKLFKVIRSKPK